jgi:hypothetical protein
MYSSRGGQKETKGRLNHWNLITKECGLKISNDKTVTIRISKNPGINIRPEVHTVVKEVYECIWDVK